MTDRQTVTLQDLPVLVEQINSLRDALTKVLDTRKAEAKARASYQVALDNFSDGSAPEAERHLQAMTAASSAENEARVLLATLKRLQAAPAVPTQVYSYWPDGSRQYMEVDHWPQRAELPATAVRFDMAVPDPAVARHKPPNAEVTGLGRNRSIDD